MTAAAGPRHPRDRDLADLGIKVDANRSRHQRPRDTDRRSGTHVRDGRRPRFDQADQRFDRLENEMRNGFTEIRGKLDQTAAGMAQIVELLIRRDDQP
ncbi:hypothetical protein [uncultured Pseudonocardia sp.]|jgi:hypothetical protein|uniref:hypothetical protein n=1 Tax=uncultured Pseudonocardia sp. TaxID=211455 RepID=UPI002628D8FA|nr:hypothetical protein [uncultured Pseudonocardia sp.]